MSTISFVNIDMHGHINPTLPIVTELVRRGHTVTYHVGSAFTDEVTAAGAKAFASPPDPPEAHPRALTPPRFLARIADEGVRRLPPLLTDLTSCSPDLVVHDTSCLWGQVAARKLGLPAATTFPTFAYNEENPSPTRPTGAFLLRCLADARATSHYVSSRVKLRTHYGLRGLPWIDLADVRQPLNLLFTSAVFQPGGDRLDPSFRCIGPCLGSRPADPSFDLDSTPTPLIYLSLGTAFSAGAEGLRALVDDLAPLAGRLVVSSGLVEPEALGDVPYNVDVHRTVPQLDVLARCDLFVTHGGANSANEGLYHGVPMLVLPQDADQPRVAARIEELGAGLSLSPGTVTADRVRDRASQVLADPSFTARAQELAQAQRAGGGPVRAAEELEAHMARAGGDR
jgi:MGT family glycosyltransferase